MLTCVQAKVRTKKVSFKVTSRLQCKDEMFASLANTYVWIASMGSRINVSFPFLVISFLTKVTLRKTLLHYHSFVLCAVSL